MSCSRCPTRSIPSPRAIRRSFTGCSSRRPPGLSSSSAAIPAGSAPSPASPWCCTPGGRILDSTSMREVSWRKVAATIFWPPARAILPVSGSFMRVSAAFFSIQASVAATARSWASTMRPSPPTSAARETDLGAEKVRSRPGRWSMSPSLPRRPSLVSEPSGTLPSRTARKVSGSTGPFSLRSSAPFPAQALASRCSGSSLA